MNRRKAIFNTGVLAGIGLSGGTLLTVFQSCKNESQLNWQPLFFSEAEGTFVARMLDLILPRTDTPGALDIKANIFIDRIIAESYDEESQQKIRSQMSDFNTACKEKYGQVFSALDENKQIEVLQSAETTSGKLNYGIWGKTIGKESPVGFYRSFKAMAVWAYLTSEEIGKNVLSYDPIPQEYKGCIPVSDVGNKWSL